MFPTMCQKLAKVTIPNEQKPDLQVWNNTISGNLSLKDAFYFKRHHFAQFHWAKTIWCKDIPPSKSLLAWRLMHDKLPTDDNLRLRGYNLPSVCNLCLKQEETSFHIFFNVPLLLMFGLGSLKLLAFHCTFSQATDIWKLCDCNWTPQCKLVIKASLINILCTIWFVRNQARFCGKVIPWTVAISMIKVDVSLSGNKTNLTFYSSMTDFNILKNFRVNIHPPKAPSIKEVIWTPPIANWVKCNIDGSSTSIASACAGVFRNSNADFIGAFADNVGLHTAFYAELAGALKAIELGFKSSVFIPWSLRNKWFNCQLLLKNMNLLVTHIYREGNDCADTLANIGLNLDNFVFWNEARDEICATN
ncbi:hypothetical protein TSUD_405370 [Trifolium subterraneum]|uniref:Reverse transcriptase zinc-binding domain-containing protein n=1 Tax=Trifolium subterraneum TaxID=3900 RepID=A0A2Z6PFD0_TRISU|nr:hypothetical protein TSUD_405370 [Trifolium subterraneum]